MLVIFPEQNLNYIFFFIIENLPTRHPKSLTKTLEDFRSVTKTFRLRNVTAMPLTLRAFVLIIRFTKWPAWLHPIRSLFPQIYPYILHTDDWGQHVMIGDIYTRHLVRNERKEGNVSFNDALNTFYLRLCGVRHMVKDQSESERRYPLPPRHGLIFPINSKGSFICTIPQTG